ncbi:MAG: hypothetical protein KZQ82_02535 [Candidatus Thiodiazotropha sp. (ex Lucinoma annulata)]|nr:hypothetical protein [Candidatus Thiodiazotropha sp. (ex Lucinoma annulata)]
MRFKLFALLASGIFSLTLLPLATASAEVVPQYYANSQWKFMPGQGVVPTMPYSFSDSRHYAAQQVAWQKGGNHPYNVESSYRFRPWQGDSSHRHRGTRFSWRHTASKPQNAWRGNSPMRRYALYPQFQQPQNIVSPEPTYWRAPAQNRAPGYQGYTTTNGFKFRTQNVHQQMDNSLKWTYRPAQLQIPNHYVYRPLQVIKQKQPLVQQRMQPLAQQNLPAYGYTPGDPTIYGRTGYRPRHVEQDPPSRRYVYGNSYARVWPQYAAPLRPSVGYPVPGTTPVSRYTGRTGFNRPRFRPLNPSGLVRYHHPGQRNRFVQNFYPAPPGYPVMDNRWRYPVGMDNVWPPRINTPYPMPGVATQRPALPSRYGVDWYDGHSDGDGAWYKLAERQEWPRVSQYVPVD